MVGLHANPKNVIVLRLEDEAFIRPTTSAVLAAPASPRPAAEPQAARQPLPLLEEAPVLPPPSKRSRGGVVGP
jgi:hypothetical protein